MVGVEQAALNVDKFKMIFDMADRERGRRHEMAMANVEDAITVPPDQPREPRELPELGAQSTGDPAQMPMPTSVPTMPGGLMPPV
jgi:hypothetical protein